jgi:hypothetical protein
MGAEDEREPGPASATPGPDERAREGIEHLQAAAREAIEALRALLDVAERVVDDPRAVQAAAGSIGGLAHAALQRLRPSEGRPAGGGEGSGGAGEDEPAGDGGRVQRIRVS